MKTFVELGTEIGELVERKNAAYGDSVATSGAMLALLYPDGLKPAQYADALLLVRIIDKLKRVATDKDAFGESPYSDISGYGLLGTHLHQQRKAQEPWQGSANGPDAEKSSEAKQPDSAEPSASGKTAPSTSAKNEPEPLPRRRSFCAQHTSAAAPSATEAASPNADGRRFGINKPSDRHSLIIWLVSDRNGRCAICNQLVNSYRLVEPLNPEVGRLAIKVCSSEHLRHAEHLLASGQVPGATI
jgi:hypothetical protein